MVIFMADSFDGCLLLGTSKGKPARASSLWKRFLSVIVFALKRQPSSQPNDDDSK